MSSKSFIGLALAAMALSPAVLQGCSSSGSNPLCCTEFKVGAEVDVGIGGNAQSQVAVQAIADIGGIASAAIDNLNTACRGIAQDLDAPQADQDAAAGNADKNAQMKAWCALAVKQIGAVKGTATLTIKVVPPVCSASVSAKLDCQAKCSGGVKCDFKANPPKCTGGTLSIACKGDCTASAGASVKCEGSCSGKCTGGCEATGGVDCTGKCEGTCEAKAGVGTGTGAQADGTCNGTCKGSCSVTPPGVTCSGSCKGTCDAACKGTATASVKCDGTCAADYEPVSCSGGKLEGGCTADAKCDANCNGSVQAKAQCTPASIEIVASADGLAKLLTTLKANLPLIFDLKTRFSAMADATASLSGNATAVVDIKAACIPPLVAAAAQAVSDIGDSVSASASITGSVGQ